jgi:hypothetical protein
MLPQGDEPVGRQPARLCAERRDPPDRDRQRARPARGLALRSGCVSSHARPGASRPARLAARARRPGAVSCGRRPPARTSACSTSEAWRSPDLVAEVNTPAYVLDEADFRARPRCGVPRRVCDRAYDVYYAGKAFLSVAVAKWVAEEGLCLDTCTGGELTVALRAGVAGRGSATTATTRRRELPARRRRRRADHRRLLPRDRADLAAVRRGGLGVPPGR